MMQTDLFSSSHNSSETVKLSDFIGYVKDAFDDFIAFKSTTVECEIKSIKKVRQFHYLELVELDSSGRIIAQARGTIFNPMVVESFIKRAKIGFFSEIIWKKITLNAWPSFHKDYGFSINIDKIFTESFVWDLQLKKDEVIKELKDKWLLGKNKETSFWNPSFNLAVISAETSEWFRDFKEILDDSEINYTYDFYEAKVWWAEAAFSVYKALEDIHTLWKEYSFIIILRWGGASEGMHWTNDRELSLMVANCNSPVITAVGHTVDVWIIDMISYKDCKTPSEAAKYIIDMYSDFENQLTLVKESIDKLVEDKIVYYKNFLDKIKILTSNINLKIASYKLELDSIYSNVLSYSPKRALEKWYAYLENEESEVISEPWVWKELILVTNSWKYKIEIKEKL